jgi:hypothetical protein
LEAHQVLNLPLLIDGFLFHFLMIKLILSHLYSHIYL